MPKFEKADLEKLIDEKEVYNAQMKIKSTLFRLKRKKVFPEEGKTIMSFLQVFNDKYTPEMDNIILELIQTYFDHIPSPLSTILAKNFDKLFIDLLNKVKYSQEKFRVFMKINKDVFNLKKQEYFSILAMESVEFGHYNIFQQTLMLSDFDEENIQMSFEIYLDKLPETEKNLALLRYVLYLMINKKMKTAYKTYEALQGIQGFGGSDEQKILEFLFFAIRMKNEKCFLQVESKYQIVIKRDSTIEKMITKVGEMYCGVANRGGFDIMGMMQGLFQ
jgi:hypothetical protein